MCIPFFHEPMIRHFYLMSDGKRTVEIVGSISKALMLTGCMVLIGMRLLIPMVELGMIPFRGQARVQRDF